jgi:hypothetical protein
MPVAIVNGKRINISAVPDSGVYGRDIIREIKPGEGRSSVIERGAARIERIQPDHRYSKDELLDKKGQPVKIRDIPDRTKGSFGSTRDRRSLAIIREQVYDVAAHLFKDGVDFDEDNGDWMVVPNFFLPPRWRHIAKSTSLLIAFPTEYPTLPPIGFYLKADIPSSPNGHLYAQAYHEAWKAPLDKNWKWYCVYVKPGSWKPAPVARAGDWKRGDNLWDYFSLIHEALGSGD